MMQGNEAVTDAWISRKNVLLKRRLSNMDIQRRLQTRFGIGTIFQRKQMALIFYS